ncbi:MAG: hypothetical protein M3P18_03475 [Actinomycetota bacterium]|nr:hypothetical protein [Actinomycetota bacterium]
MATVARSAALASGAKTITSKSRATAVDPGRQAALRMLSTGSGRAAVVPGVVLLPGVFGRTVSEPARVLSAAKTLSGWEAG